MTILPRMTTYKRENSLPELMPCYPWECAPESYLEFQAYALYNVLTTRRKLKILLKNLKKRGESGHWTYDVSTHLHFLHAIHGESTIALGLIRAARERRQRGVMR